MAAKLGILAGGGDLPRQIILACEESGRPYYVVALSGHAAPELARHGGAARLGAVGTILIHYSKTHVVVEVNRKLPALKLVEDDTSTR